MKLEERIEQLRQLRNVEPDPATDSKLRRALNDRSNLIVAEAAEIVGHHRRTSLPTSALTHNYLIDKLYELQGRPAKIPNSSLFLR
jgi:hypothetical protein